METKTNILKEIIKNKTKLIILGILILILIFSIVIVCTYTKKETITNEILISEIKKSSELTTIKLNYKGLTEYKDKGITFINKSNFIMVYNATARAGIDVDKIEIKVNDITKKVNIKMPKAEILEVKVNPSTVKYYDEKFALFNFNEKEDANKAQELAEKEAKKELNKMGILDYADKQSETLIKGLILNLIPKDYKINFQK